MYFCVNEFKVGVKVSIFSGKCTMINATVRNTQNAFWLPEQQHRNSWFTICYLILLTEVQIEQSYSAIKLLRFTFIDLIHTLTLEQITTTEKL